MNDTNRKSTSEQNQSSTQAGNIPRIPEDALIILPVRNTVLFPGVVLPVSIGRQQSIAAAQEAARNEQPIGIVLQRDEKSETPGLDDLYQVGTQAEILRYMTTEGASHHLVCRGEGRFRIIDLLAGFPFLVARIEPISRAELLTPDVEARLDILKERAREAIEMLPGVPAEVVHAIENMASASALADFVSGLMDFKPKEKQELLELIDVKLRLDKVLELLSPRIEVLKIRREIDEQMQQSISEQQRERLLREQLRTIQQKLGEGDKGAAEIAEIEKAIVKAQLPPEAEEQARTELNRLQRMPEAAAEYATIRTYLDWLAELPWSVMSETEIDMAEARRILDEDHYGLEKVKRRIIEYLAVRKLSREGHGPILCFVGPPGVGKTSLGQSIARAMGRKFVRISLGGVHDEAEIRGHRRTYVGALPGNIIQAVRKAGTRDPVFMLDEMDKLGAGFHGDPSSALLEVLDPEQNVAFRDNYLGVTFDLSQVVFIGTANVLDNIPGPLRDRMEVIELPGYTEDEKLEIAKRYLVGRQLAANGLASEQSVISDEAIRTIIHDYTREAGCRNLERTIGSVFRSVAVQIVEGSSEKVGIDVADLKAILGPRKFESGVAMRTSVPGVATGLAWTPVGGDILFIEATKVPGTGKLILTGQLGDVMKESAQASLSLVKGRASAFGVDPGIFEKSDIHIHVPAGAIPKDGPSAGVAMFSALASLLTGRTIRSDTAMTGEISLRGLVLPIGGVKEKVLGAARAGITTVLLPARNRKDLEDIPESARNRVQFIWLEDVDDALEAALQPEDASRAVSN